MIKSVKFLKVGYMVLDFAFYGGLEVVIREGCTVIIRVKLIICGRESHL